MTIVRAYNGFLTTTVLTDYCFGLGGVIIGTSLGAYVFKHIPNRIFRYIVYAYPSLWKGGASVSMGDPFGLMLPSAFAGVLPLPGRSVRTIVFFSALRASAALPFAEMCIEE